MKTKTSEAYIMCKGWPDEPVKRMYFSRGLSNMIGNKSRIFLNDLDTDIFISSNQIENSNPILLFDMKTATVAYSTVLMKAITRLPGCPRSDFCLSGWEKLEGNSVHLNLAKAVFKEGECGP